MRKKLERFFAAFDRCRSERIAREDALALVRKLSERCAPELKAELEGKMEAFWCGGLRGGRRPVRQIDFLAETTLARSDPASQKVELTQTLPELADLLFRASAHDGRVSRTDFTLFQRAMGAIDDAQGRRTFDALDVDSAGFLSAADFEKAVVLFFTSDDEAEPANLLLGSLDAQPGLIETICHHAARMLYFG
jgi:hypothetical protein